MGPFVLLSLCTAGWTLLHTMAPDVDWAPAPATRMLARAYLQPSECASRLTALSHMTDHLSAWHRNHCFAERQPAVPAVGLPAWHQPLA